MSISLTDIFLLWHTHNLTDDFGTHEEIKLIGVFSSEAKASEAIELVKDIYGLLSMTGKRPYCYKRKI